MTALLRHLLSPAYLYAQNDVPMGRWSVGQVAVLVLLLALAVGSAWLARRRLIQPTGALAPGVSAAAAGLGLVALMLHIYGTGALSARVWYLCALVTACLALTASLLPRAAGGPLGRLALPFALLPDTSYGRRGYLLALSPILLIGVAELARWVVGDLLGVPIDLYRAFPFPDPWSLWFDRRVALAAGLSWAALAVGSRALSTSRWRAEPAALAGVALGVGAAGWYLTIVARGLSHGAAGSDPFCYLQMAKDLALRGTPLHVYPLADLAREAKVSLWPVVHVGYHPPGAGHLAPTVWPIGWSLLLALPYRLGGEAAAMGAAPLCALLAALLTAVLTKAMRPGNDQAAWLVGGLAAALLLTSDEAVRRTLVPMADAAAQLLAVATVLAMVQIVQRDRLVWSALTGAALALAYWVRHPLLPMVLGVPVALALLRAPWQRRLAHGVVLSAAALLLALLDLVYHQRVFGSLWATESPEASLIALRHIPDTLAALARDGLLRRREWGYLWPLVGAGMWAQLRSSATRRWAFLMLATLLPTLMLNLAYSAVRYRDLISLLPWFAVWAAWGVGWLWDVAARRRYAVVRALAIGLSIVLLSARTAPTLDAAPWREPQVFGHITAAQRAEFTRLADALPESAIVATSLGSGAIERYTGHSTVRPYYWSPGEFRRFVAAATRRGAPVYLLDDGQEIERLVITLRDDLLLEPYGSYNLPTYGLGGEELNRPATLYLIGDGVSPR